MQATCMEFHTNNLLAVKWDSLWRSSHLGFTCSEWIPTQRDFFQLSACLQLSPARAGEGRQILVCSSSLESGRNHAGRCKGAWTTRLRWCHQTPCAVLSGNLLLIHFGVHFMPGLLSSPVISNRPFDLNDSIQGRLVIRAGDGLGIWTHTPVMGPKERHPVSPCPICWEKHLTPQLSGRLAVLHRQKLWKGPEIPHLYMTWENRGLPLV